MLHLHLTSIVLIAVLFLVVFFMYRGNTESNLPKILHMVLRLLYIVAIGSGLIAYVQNMDYISAIDGHMIYGIKALLGIFAVAALEVALVRTKKAHKSSTAMFAVAVVLLIATVLVGASLDMGALNFF